MDNINDLYIDIWVWKDFDIQLELQNLSIVLYFPLFYTHLFLGYLWLPCYYHSL